MYYVYLLRDDDKRIYIGCTNNLKRLIREHLNNKTYWVRRMKNPKLFYYEAYNNKGAAQERERKLKIRGSAYQGLVKRINVK